MASAHDSADGRRDRARWLDVSRVIAIISVICNHAASRSYALYRDVPEEFARMSRGASLLKAAIYVFSRLGVPLFLMISGALLMGRDYEDRAVARRFIRHNWWGLLRTTWIWLTVMFLYLQLMGDSVFRQSGPLAAALRYVMTMLFMNQVTFGSMWYMPMILCVYLMIPVLSIALKRLDNRIIVGMACAIAVSSMLVPNLNAALKGMGLDKSLVLEMRSSYLFSVYMVYVLCGYWISRGLLDRLPSWLTGAGFVGAFLATALFQYWMYTANPDYSVVYHDIGVLISGAFLFECLRRRFAIPSKGARTVTQLSRFAFGIYFLHICVMTGLVSLLDRAGFHEPFPRFLLLASASFFLSWGIMGMTHTVPVLRKYFYLLKE